MDGSLRNSGSRNPQTNSKRMTLISTRARSEFTLFVSPRSPTCGHSGALTASPHYWRKAALRRRSGSTPHSVSPTRQDELTFFCAAWRFAASLNRRPMPACSVSCGQSMPRLVPRSCLAAAEKLDADQRVRLFRSSPFEKLTWLIVDAYGAESQRALLEGSVPTVESQAFRFRPERTR